MTVEIGQRWTEVGQNDKDWPTSCPLFGPRDKKMICSDYGIVPTASAIRRPFIEDMNGTGQITFLTCAHAEVILDVQERGEWPSVLRQSNKVQTAWTKEWQKQDVADQRVEIHLHLSIYHCVYFPPAISLNRFFLPFICIPTSMFNYFSHILYPGRQRVMRVCVSSRPPCWVGLKQHKQQS